MEDLKSDEVNALPAYHNRYKRKKLLTCCDKVYNYFRSLNVPEDVIECESFTVISIDS